MAFGQPSGPPASAKQMSELLALLIEAGHSDFRDARGPMGFTQRQAGGKFSRDEADAFITQLTDADPHEPAPAHTSFQKKSTIAASRPTPNQRSLKKVSDAELAAELQSRGWVVMEP